MVNKKGIIKIIEASIAVLVILTAIISISMMKKSVVERDLSGTINPLLEEIAKNSTLREEVIIDSDASESVKSFLAKRIKDPSIGFDTKVCEINDACSLDRYPANITGNVYAGSRLISSGLISGEKPKRIGLFLWIRA